jgi:hypothetical protein
MQFAFGRVMEEAHQQFILGYVSNQGTERAVFRHIRVTSGESDQRRIVNHRQGYIQYP